MHLLKWQRPHLDVSILWTNKTRPEIVGQSWCFFEALLCTLLFRLVLNKGFWEYGPTALSKAQKYIHYHKYWKRGTTTLPNIRRPLSVGARHFPKHRSLTEHFSTVHTMVNSATVQTLPWNNGTNTWYPETCPKRATAIKHSELQQKLVS